MLRFVGPESMSRSARIERKINRSAARLERSIRSASITIVVCVMLWAATGAGYFWPGWVILGGALLVAAKARRLHRSLDRFDGDGYRLL